MMVTGLVMLVLNKIICSINNIMFITLIYHLLITVLFLPVSVKDVFVKESNKR